MKRLQIALFTTIALLTLLQIGCSHKVDGEWIAQMTRADYAFLFFYDEQELEQSGVKDSFDIIKLVLHTNGSAQFIGLSPLDGSEDDVINCTYRVIGSNVELSLDNDIVVLAVKSPLFGESTLSGKFNNLRLTFKRK